MPRFEYLTDPQDIERRSFAAIRQLTDLSRFDADQQQVAMRLVHTSGDPTLVEALSFSADAVTAGCTALKRGAGVLCDVKMVRHGISQRFLNGGQVHCFLEEATEMAPTTSGETRSMVAIAHWRDHLADNLVAIGNAPTALFRLLELLYDGAPRPALIIGMPVGFISAAEAKEALVEHAAMLGVPYITLRGRRGGSALAAATLNALARLARGLRF